MDVARKEPVGEGNGKAKRTGNLWVLALDPETKERAGFVCCPRGAAMLHTESFKMRGYEVQTLESDEAEALIAKISQAEGAGGENSARSNEADNR